MIIIVCRAEIASIANSAIKGGGGLVGEHAIDLYRQIFEKYGQLLIVDSTAELADRVRQYQAQGEACMYLSFCLPHELDTDIPCPVVAAFGWPYSNLPDEPWAGNEHNDWRTVLRRTAGAITFSPYGAEVVRKAMGADYNVAVVPAPVWDEYARLAESAEPTNPARRQTLHCKQPLLDTGMIDFRRDQEAVLSELFDDDGVAGTSIELDGIVYTAVIDPASELENWHDFLWAFCWAFREKTDVMLVILLKETEVVQAFARILKALYNLEPYQCRVVVICGPVPQEEYRKLVLGSSYIVNSACAEAQCLPLMEFMSAGVPALAPDHTALAEYVDERSAFVVASSLEWVEWPHDPRIVRRTFRYRINWESLLNQFLESYTVASEDVERYHAMSRFAAQNQNRFCSVSALEPNLNTFFKAIRASGDKPRSVMPRLRNRIKKLLRMTR